MTLIAVSQHRNGGIPQVVPGQIRGGIDPHGHRVYTKWRPGDRAAGAMLRAGRLERLQKPLTPPPQKMF